MSHACQPTLLTIQSTRFKLIACPGGQHAGNPYLLSSARCYSVRRFSVRPSFPFVLCGRPGQRLFCCSRASMNLPVVFDAAIIIPTFIKPPKTRTENQLTKSSFANRYCFRKKRFRFCQNARLTQTHRATLRGVSSSIMLLRFRCVKQFLP